MALLQALIAALIHSLGRILNTVFGWATAMLFGRIDQRQQLLMSISSFGSVLWLLAVIGIIWPAAGLWLTTSVVPPNIAKYKHIIRLAMLGAAAVIPFIVGGGLLWAGLEDGKGFKQKAKQILAGWPYTVGLALTMLLMLVFAPALKLRTWRKRWTTQHIPVLVPNGDYLDALADVQAVLVEEGYTPSGRPASWMLTIPTRVLSWFAKSQSNKLLADKLTVLQAKDFAILLHPSDLIISGTPDMVPKLRSLLVQRLAFTHIKMTWTRQANEFEEQLTRLWHRIHSGDATNCDTILPDLLELEQQIHCAKLSYDEWEVLFRERLQVEHEIFMTDSDRLRKAG